ncbi:50S ribosomal protein L25 [Chlamydiales bacterium STE3]|nr:50S ribosomal protein L25 [Chlamydiales bacterium STE3]
MELQVSKRDSTRKCEAKRLRREGQIPAVIYNRNQPGETVSIDNTVFSAFLRKITPGHLPTTVFTLIGAEKTRKAILKDIQYHPTTYSVIHLDFEELVDNIPVNVKVPVEFTGVADSSGLKLGGVLRHVKRHIKVNCLPKDIPSHFQLDVREMSILENKKVKDLTIPENVRSLVDENQVIVVIAKR